MSLCQAGHGAEWELCGDTSPLQLSLILHRHCLTQLCSTALLCHFPVQPMESTHCSQDLGGVCLVLGQKEGERGKLVLLLCTAQGLWQCPGEGRNPDPKSSPLLSKARTAASTQEQVLPGPVCVGREEAPEHIQAWLPGGASLSHWATCPWGRRQGASPGCFPESQERTEGP